VRDAEFAREVGQGHSLREFIGSLTKRFAHGVYMDVDKEGSLFTKL